MNAYYKDCANFLDYAKLISLSPSFVVTTVQLLKVSVTNGTTM